MRLFKLHIARRQHPDVLAASPGPRQPVPPTWRSTTLRDLTSRGLLAICAALLIGGCDQATAPAPGLDPAATGLVLAAHREDPKATLLVSGLEGALGSAIGPDGALYVAEGAAGRISRIDPRSGATTTFASGLPQRVLPPEGGVMDVAFIGRTAYALVSLVGSDVGGDEVVGIYRVDGPESFTVVADIGAFNVANPPTEDFVIEAPTGYQIALEPYRGGFLVSDGHLNRVLRVTRDGEISVVIAFGNIVPTGLAASGNTVYLAQAGPLPHRPQDGKIVSFTQKSPTARKVASGARLLVDVEFGPGHSLYALSQGVWVGTVPGTPATPNTGSLVRVNKNGTFAVIVDGLNQPTSLEFIGNTAYVVNYLGEIWKIKGVSH